MKDLPIAIISMCNSLFHVDPIVDVMKSPNFGELPVVRVLANISANYIYFDQNQVCSQKIHANSSCVWRGRS